MRNKYYKLVLPVDMLTYLKGLGRTSYTEWQEWINNQWMYTIRFTRSRAYNVLKKAYNDGFRDMFIIHKTNIIYYNDAKTKILKKQKVRKGRRIKRNRR